MAGNIAKANDLNLGRGLLLKIISVINSIFLFSPLIIVMIYSFNSSRVVTDWQGFSLKWYKEILQDVTLWISIRNSLVIGILNMIFTTILSVMLAMSLHKYNLKNNQVLMNLIYIPIILPEIIFGTALLSLFILIKFPLGMISILCAHITFSISFVTLIILAKIEHFDKNLEEASRDLGAGGFYTFRRVILPVIAPGIISGALFAFTLSIDDFIITFFTAGVGSSTLPLKIYSLVKFGVTPSVNAISTLIILFTITAILIVYLSQKTGPVRKIAQTGGITLIIIVVAALAISTFITGSKQILYIYNYSEYMSPTLISNFEKKYNAKIVLNYFNDNEEMLSKMQAGFSGYDIIVPSGYMVEIMIKQKLLSEINFKNIPNYKYLDERFKKLPYDPETKYSIPYAYGFTGISYNSDIIKETPDSLNIMWDERYKGKILMVDDMREVFNYGYRKLGYNLNDKDPQHLKEAFDVLLKQKPLLKKYESNMMVDYLISGEVYIAMLWSGGAYRLKQEHPNFKFFVPKEALTLFIDNMCIPAKAPHKDLAEKFLDHLYDPEQTAINIRDISYAMPNTEAYKYVDDTMKTDPILFPQIEDSSKYIFIGDLGEFNAELEKAWVELKNR